MRPIQVFRNVLQVSVVCLSFLACNEPLPEEQVEKTRTGQVPLSIDYNEVGGSLSNLIYRAKFAYNNSGQLVSVTDSVLTPPATPNGRALPWVNFYYQQGKLSEIVLRSNAIYFDQYNPQTDQNASRFYFEYSGNTVNVRQAVGAKQLRTFDFKTDGNGFPVRNNVVYGSTFLDAAGNIDYVAETNAAKERNPLGAWEVLDRKFDNHKNIFANSKEFQMLGVALAVSEWNMTTSFVPYLGILTTNNELSRTSRYCSTTEGCRLVSIVESETSSVDGKGFPTLRLTQVGIMGRHQYVVTYQKGKN